MRSRNTRPELDACGEEERELGRQSITDGTSMVEGKINGRKLGALLRGKVGQNELGFCCR
jgi:hypothetical protein